MNLQKQLLLKHQGIQAFPSMDNQQTKKWGIKKIKRFTSLHTLQAGKKLCCYNKLFL